MFMFIPIDTGCISFFMVIYDQLYAKIYHLYKSGRRYWTKLEEIKEINTYNENFSAPDIDKEAVLAYFEPPVEGQKVEFVTVMQVMEVANSRLKQPLNGHRIGHIMKKTGFQAIKQNGQRGYLVHRLPPSNY